jgi:hypothetical protein
MSRCDRQAAHGSMVSSMSGPQAHHAEAIGRAKCMQRYIRTST